MEARLAGTMGQCPGCGGPLEIPQLPDDVAAAQAAQPQQETARSGTADRTALSDPVADENAAESIEKPAATATTDSVEQQPIAEAGAGETKLPPDNVPASKTPSRQTDDFDPMDVLGEEEPRPPKDVTPSVPSTPDKSLPADSTDASLLSKDPEPAPTGTAASAADAVESMLAGPVPRAAGSTDAEIEEPAASLREQAKETFSGGSFVGTLRNNKLYATLAGSILLALVVFLPRGCSNRIATYPVSGRVVFKDGTPVRTGTIEFEHQDGLKMPAVNGKIDDNGNFVLGTYENKDGAPAGLYKASVTQMVISDGTFTHEKDHGRPVAYKYRHPDTSGLQLTVEAKEGNRLKIVVEEEPKRSGFYEENPTDPG